MEKKSIADLARERVVLLDGGMGTMLIAKGLKEGEAPDLWNVNFPDKVRDVHSEYLEAGADAIITNTFGASRIKLASCGIEDRGKEINRAGAEIAKSACSDEQYVIGDIGPSGRFLEPYGDLKEEDLCASVEEQATALLAGGVDCLVIETVFDVREAVAALKIVKKLTNLPVIVSFTFNKTTRGYYTITGNSVKEAVQTVDNEGADIIGTNCSLDSSLFIELVKEIKAHTEKPVAAKPNAGKPVLTDEKITYEQSIGEFIKDVPLLLQNGANLIGGCCGTTPAHIAAIHQLLNR